jgi:ABC-type spermidine/putrescine transport system permease subunit II
LKVAVQVTIVSTIVGTAAAFPLVRSTLPFRSGVRIGLTLPIMIPGLLIGVSLLVFLTDVFHMQLSSTTAVIGQAVYCTVRSLLVASRLRGDRSLERAASDLGANTYARMRYVVPADRAGDLRRGAVRIHALLDEFIITLFLIGGATSLPDLHLYAGEVRDHPR